MADAIVMVVEITLTAGGLVSITVTRLSKYNSYTLLINFNNQIATLTHILKFFTILYNMQ